MKFIKLIRGDGGIIYFGEGVIVEEPFPKEQFTRVTTGGVTRNVKGAAEEIVRKFETGAE